MSDNPKFHRVVAQPIPDVRIVEAGLGQWLARLFGRGGNKVGWDAASFLTKLRTLSASPGLSAAEKAHLESLQKIYSAGGNLTKNRVHNRFMDEVQSVIGGAPGSAPAIQGHHLGTLARAYETSLSQEMKGGVASLANKLTKLFGTDSSKILDERVSGVSVVSGRSAKPANPTLRELLGDASQTYKVTKPAEFDASMSRALSTISGDMAKLNLAKNTIRGALFAVGIYGLATVGYKAKTYGDIFGHSNPPYAEDTQHIWNLKEQGTDPSESRGPSTGPSTGTNPYGVATNSGNFGNLPSNVNPQTPAPHLNLPTGRDGLVPMESFDYYDVFGKKSAKEEENVRLASVEAVQMLEGLPKFIPIDEAIATVQKILMNGNMSNQSLMQAEAYADYVAGGASNFGRALSTLQRELTEGQANMLPQQEQK